MKSLLRDEIEVEIEKNHNYKPQGHYFCWNIIDAHYFGFSHDEAILCGGDFDTEQEAIDDFKSIAKLHGWTKYKFVVK